MASGLLMASVVTLIGIWRDLSPEVILLRAAVAGTVCGILARLACIVLTEDRG